MEKIIYLGDSRNEAEMKKGLSTSIERLRLNYDKGELGVIFKRNTGTEYIYKATQEELNRIENGDSAGGLVGILLSTKDEDGKYRRNSFRTEDV